MTIVVELLLIFETFSVEYKRYKMGDPRKGSLIGEAEMGNVADKINELRVREAKVAEMGGAKAVAKQHETGKMTARERLLHFFD
ncbi:MAG TPA: hypothetical protein DEO88_10725, partial [Syntrophobacteraceae bacterium]|nr:hypothetical protein [Syntrophobacteraceae bacterium]